MTRIHKILLVTALTVVGVWGCAKAPTAANGDRTKQLEARVAKLETELKEVISGRDLLRNRLAETEANLAAAENRAKQFAAKAAGAERDRDDLLAKLKAKSVERDQLQAQFDSFRKNLKDLLGQADTAANGTTGVTTGPIVAGLR
jgi:septal ring factor EnvC (AmiA/AmiB activator)